MNAYDTAYSAGSAAFYKPDRAYPVQFYDDSFALCEETGARCVELIRFPYCMVSRLEYRRPAPHSDGLLHLHIGSYAQFEDCARFVFKASDEERFARLRRFLLERVPQ